MAVSLNTGNGIEVTAAADGSLYRNMFGEGFHVLETGNQFKIEIVSNTAIKILDGDAIMEGRHIWTKPDDSTILNIEAGEQGKKRTDNIFLKYTNNGGVEKVEFEVVKGNSIPSSDGYNHNTSWRNESILKGGKEYKALLYCVDINGLNIENYKKFFVPLQSLYELDKRLQEVERKLNSIS